MGIDAVMYEVDERIQTENLCSEVMTLVQQTNPDGELWIVHSIMAARLLA
jgi:hypothetical protein